MKSTYSRYLTGLAAVLLLVTAPRAAKAFSYVLDDGTAEDSIGLTAGGTFITANEFTVSGGNNLVNSISIAWGTPAFPDPTLNGLSYTAVLWSDPNGDGSPTDAVVLATAPGVIALEGTNTFLTSFISPTTVLTPNFFVGFVVTGAAGQFPAAFDETAPLPNRSFINLGSNPSDMSGAAAIESFGLVGNWLIRADATQVPEPSTWAMMGVGAVMLAGLLRFRRRTS